MGENRYAVQIAVDVDTSHLTTNETQYGKGDNTVVSEEHSLTPVGAAANGGVPGLTSNLPIANANPKPNVAAAPSAEASPDASATASAMPAKLDSQTGNIDVARKDIVNYKPSVREINSETAPARIRRISVAAGLD